MRKDSGRESKRYCKMWVRESTMQAQVHQHKYQLQMLITVSCSLYAIDS